LIEEIAKRIEAKGIEAWFDLDAKELLGADAEHYEKMSDTLDVWFDLQSIMKKCRIPWMFGLIRV